MDDEIKMMLNTIMDDIGRVEDKADRHFEKIEKELDTLHHEVTA